MLEIVIICIFLSVLPVVLWSIPKTRRMTGSWLTALKTVPVGCLSAFLIPILVYEIVKIANDTWKFIPKRGVGIMGLPLAVLGVCFGVFVIVKFANFVWRKFHAEGKRSWLPFLFIFFVLGGCVLIASFAIPIIHYGISKEAYRGRWTTIELPPENGVYLAFEQCSIHPFLAEYDYRLRFMSGGKTEYKMLQTNTGGRTYFNIYRLKDGRLLFTDKDCDYIVDVAKREILYLFQHNGKMYAVSYSNEKHGSWGWGEESGKVIFRYSNNKRREAFPLSGELLGKIYYGCITDDFHAASEIPEKTIDKSRKR